MGHELRIERELSLDFLRVCEAAAIAAARTMGQGDRKYSDHVAVEAMREVMDTVPMRGRIVIGEGERDEAPMLYIGEEVGGGFGSKLQIYAEAGIPEYWIVNVVDGVIEVYTVPAAGRYQTIRRVPRGGSLSLPGGLPGSISVTDILGPTPQAEGGSDA